MKSNIIGVFLLISSTFARGTVDCIWTSQKEGILIKYIASCDSKYKTTIDSFLNVVVEQLRRQDTSLKILVFVNNRSLHFPGSTNSYFYSIAFDTLRDIDNDFIFDYYGNQTSISAAKNGGFNTYRSQDTPLDINVTNSKDASKLVGIKIFYAVDYHAEGPIWTDLMKGIIYSATYPNLIKEQQRRDTVRYFTNGYYLSLLTIDSFAINKIIGKKAIKAEKVDEKNMTGVNFNYLFLGLAIVVVLWIGVHFFKKPS